MTVQINQSMHLVCIRYSHLVEVQVTCAFYYEPNEKVLFPGTDLKGNNC